ncbi:MAG: ribosomal RNA small subunit methyltransferase A [Spirochaetaceae bacterium]|nr:MAG: ribosomal RNA small subunit methyltransferase A [Spirochaetaceae bacterium]
MSSFETEGQNFFARLDNSPAAIRAYLEERGLSAGKRFGQNFMVCQEVRAELVASLGASAGSRVWEIGPGLGAMTAMCLDAKLHTTAFEIDRGFVSHLQERFACESEFRLVPGDCLKTMPTEMRESSAPEFVLGNLPYNAAAQIIWYLLGRENGAQRLVFTIQKEAADRMLAAESSRSFGPLAILCNLEYETRKIRTIPGECFYPRPQVTSTAIALTRVRTVPHDTKTAILAAADAAFSARRKTLLNNFGKALGDRPGAGRRLTAIGIDPSRRAESLQQADFLKLAEAFPELGQARMSS